MIIKIKCPEYAHRTFFVIFLSALSPLRGTRTCITVREDIYENLHAYEASNNANEFKNSIF